MAQAISRRVFLTRFGRTAATLAVIGVSVSGCDADDNADPAADSTVTASRSDDASPSVSASTGRPAEETPSPASEDPPVEVPTEGELEGGVTWRRVKLSIVSAYIVARDGEAALVDTGVNGSTATIEEGLDALDLGWGDVGHVLITHKHDDHTGSLRGVMERSPDAVAYAGAEDIPAFNSPRPVTPLTDGDRIFGLQAIATPGHTAGHFSFLDPAGLLLAGDALNGSGGGVTGPSANFTSDMEMGLASVRKLAELGFDTVLFGHGDPVVGDASTLVQALVESL